MVPLKISKIKATDHNEKSVRITKTANNPRIVNIAISQGTCIITCTSCILCTVFTLHLKNVGVRIEKVWKRKIRKTAKN